MDVFIDIMKKAAKEWNIGLKAAVKLFMNAPSGTILQVSHEYIFVLLYENYKQLSGCSLFA